MGGKTKKRTVHAPTCCTRRFGTVGNPKLIPRVFPLFLLLPSSSSQENAAAAAAPETVRKKTPSDFLKSVLGRPVRVQLNTGLEYRGILACLDGACVEKDIAKKRADLFFSLCQPANGAYALCMC